MGQKSGSVTRRMFVAGTIAAATSLAGTARAEEPAKKVKLGVVGNGGRGSWIAKLFQKHGGYEMHAVADYFQEVADACGNELGVDKNRRFSGLSGYKRLIESGVEAVALETPPYFLPEQARAVIDAGLHLYMAKPVCSDVPGAMSILESAKKAKAAKRVFLVDYQMPTDPINIEVAKRIREGGLGKLAHLTTFGYCTGFPDPPKTANLESRLRGLIWVNDAAMGCDYIGNFDIHAIDAAIWTLGKRPTAASGHSRICRADPHGDSRDVCMVHYELQDGPIWTHHGQALPNNPDEGLVAKFYGTKASAIINYWGKSFLRGGDKHYGGGNVENLYESGASRNIEAFHDAVTKGNFENPTVQRAVDGALACILGKEAAARHGRMTLEELIKENRRLEVDLAGLRQ